MKFNFGITYSMVILTKMCQKRYLENDIKS